MTVRVGVLGGGSMGAAHARLLASTIAGADLIGVYDPDPARAIGPWDEPRDLIDAADAVVVASPDDTHERYVLTCVAAGKPVLCEKPLASTVEACRRLVEVDERGLVQVGFMRRYDPGYLELKRLLDTGALGTPLLLHCVHRNAVAPPGFGSEELLTSSATHEIDTARWLLGEEITEATVRTPRSSGLLDPQLLLLRAASGVLVDVEIFINARYGYDVRCEIVGEAATASLRQPAGVAVRGDGAIRVTTARDWCDRFSEAYRAELQSWVDGVVAGRRHGPGAWDGYAATVVAQACVEALRSGETRPVNGVLRPPGR